MSNRGVFLKIFRTKHKKLNFWLDVVLIVAASSAMMYAFFWPVRVTGNSMSPAVNSGNQLIASRFLGSFGQLRAGDVVMVRLDDGIAIKRLAAAPGDHILLEANRLYINGVLANWEIIGQAGTTVDQTLGDDEFFLLGDNLNISTDSRHFGPVNNRQIMAKILIRYFPLTDIRFY